jgi:tripartite-type tricarboxylate transporter receptor subunit TctC
MTRGSFLIASALVFALAGHAVAQEKYPNRPVKVLVPYAPGGATDIVARIVTEPMRQTLGQPFVIENKPGAGGIIAIEELARSKPDGYTLMLGNVNTNVITPVIFPKKISFDYFQRVVPVARVADVASLLVATTTGFPPKTFAEFIAHAKQNPNKVRFSSVGVGSFIQFDMEILAKRAGVQLVHIPNKQGAAGSVKDIATGDAHVAFLNIATTAPLIRGGQMRPLAIVADKRVPEYPDVPTMAEAGYPGVGTLQWLGIFAPAGVPNDILETLHSEIVKAINSPAGQEAFRKQNMRPVPTKSTADAKAWLASERQLWLKIVDEAKIDLAD